VIYVLDLGDEITTERSFSRAKKKQKTTTTKKLIEKSWNIPF